MKKFEALGLVIIFCASLHLSLTISIAFSIPSMLSSSYLAYFLRALFTPYLIPMKSTISPEFFPGNALFTLEIV